MQRPEFILENLVLDKGQQKPYLDRATVFVTNFTQVLSDQLEPQFGFSLRLFSSGFHGTAQQLSPQTTANTCIRKFAAVLSMMSENTLQDEDAVWTVAS